MFLALWRFLGWMRGFFFSLDAIYNDIVLEKKLQYTRAMARACVFFKQKCDFEGRANIPTNNQKKDNLIFFSLY